MNIEYLKTANSNNIDVNRLMQSAEKTGKSSSNSQTSESAEDKLSISTEARDLQHTDVAVKTALSGMPEVREEKLLAVREKLNSGHYFSEENLDDTADSLIAEFSKSSRRAEESTLKVLLNKIDEEPEIRQSAVKDASAKSAAGFYNTEESIRMSAEKLWLPPIHRR